MLHGKNIWKMFFAGVYHPTFTLFRCEERAQLLYLPYWIHQSLPPSQQGDLGCYFVVCQAPLVSFITFYFKFSLPERCIVASKLSLVNCLPCPLLKMEQDSWRCGGGALSLQPCPPSYAAEGQCVWSPSRGWPGLLNPYCGVVPVHHPPGAMQVLWAFLCAWRSKLPLLPSPLRCRGLTSLIASPSPPSLLTSSEGTLTPNF